MHEIFKQALQQFRSGHLQQAEQLCYQLWASNPEDADTLHLLAIIYARTQRTALAHEYFQQALAQAPDRGDFCANYANLLWESGRIEATIHYSQRAIALPNPRPEAYNTLGNALFRLGNFAEAITHYRAALELSADYAEAHNNLGQALKALDDWQAAELSFRQALSLRPDFNLAADNLKQVDRLWLQPVIGKRLSLRRTAVSDAEYIFACYQNQAFMHFYNRLVQVQSLEHLSQQLQEESKTHPYQNKAINWVIMHNTRQHPLGLANLVDIQLTHRRAEFLVGIPEQQDRHAGSGLEATLLVLDFAFNRLQLNKIITLIYSDNQASLDNNVALGFRRESYFQQHLWDSKQQHFIDLYGNALTLDAFRANRRLGKLSLRLLGRDITQP